MGILNSKKLNQEAQKLLDKVGVGDIRAETMVSSLSFEERKLVEIARAFYKLPELFIVDETTTALPQKGRNILYRLIKELQDAGKSVLFISHDIDELIQVCNCVTILRDGRYIATLEQGEMEPRKMKELMVGREIADNCYRSDYVCSCVSDKPLLTVKNLTCGILQDISFELKTGEILGVCGLSDCGIHELGKAVFGLLHSESGEIVTADGTHIHTPKQAIHKRIGFMSKNRDTESMLISMTIQENIVLPSLDHLKVAGFFIPPKRERELATTWAKALSVKMRELNQACSELSGGNKQKIVLAKWLGNGSEVFILDCPTRGIDIGVKVAIYRIMEQLKSEGKSIIMISEEMPEVLGMSDRIMVMKDGKIVKTFERSADLAENTIIQYMI